MLIFSFIIPLAILGLIVWGLVKFFSHRKRKHPSKDKAWYLRLAFSKDDAVSQWLLLLGFLFFGIALQAFNKNFNEVIPPLLLLLFVAIVALVATYYWRLLYTLVFSLFALVAWWLAKAVEWANIADIRPAGVFTGFVFIVLLFYLLARWHEKDIKFKRFSLVYLILGLLPFIGLVIYMSTKFGIYFLQELLVGSSIFSSWQLVASLALLAAVIIGLLFYLLNRKLISVYEAAAVIVALLLFLVITLFLPEQNLFYRGSMYSFRAARSLSSAGVVLAVIFNVWSFLQLVGLILLGYLRREVALINSGAAVIFIFIIVKYFDWFFSFMDKSLFFVGAGILMFVLGWFMEKGRRAMLDNLRASKNIKI